MPRPNSASGDFFVRENAPLARRTLLRAGAALAASSLLGPTPAAAADPIAEGPGRPLELSLGFGTYGLPGMTTEEAIDLTAATGYDSIELCLLPDFDSAPEKLTAERRRSIRERLASKSLILSSLMENLPLAVDDAKHRANLDRLNAAFELAHDLAGAERPIVQTVLGSPAGKWAEVKEKFVERLRDWLAAAEAADATLAVKPHRMNALGTPAEFVELAEALGNPKRLKLVFDWSHYAFRGLDLAQQIRLARPHLGHVAVKDAVERDGQIDFALPGAGGPAAGDYVELLQQLLKNGYAGDVSVEVTKRIWSAPGYDPRAAIKSSYEFLAGRFAAAGIGRKRRKS